MIAANGKSYARLDEMPPEARQSNRQAMNVLAEKNRNGMPDVLEEINAQTTATTSAQFIAA
jgi:hypothetical protein